MNGSRFRSQRGSMPMVLLAAIVLGGIVVALFTTVSTGTDTARRDRDWQSAVQVADAGIQQAFVVLRDLDEDAEFAPCDLDEDGTCEGILDGNSFRWQYERVAAGSPLWEVRSVGEVGDSARVLRANVGPRQLFPVAMLSKDSLTYNGAGTGVDEKFSVGSFGSISLQGNANDQINSIVKYGPGPHSINATLDNVTHATNWSTDDLRNVAHEAYDDLNRCGDGHGNYAGDVYPDDFATPGVRGAIYCAGRVNFSVNESYELSGPEGQAVEVYVRNAGTSNSLHVRTNARVHWDTADGPGDASEHLFFIESGAVVLQGGAKFSGGIYAPNSSCTSNGQPDVNGALVCNSITLNGNFGYSHQLAGVTEGPFMINEFWEDSGGA